MQQQENRAEQMIAAMFDTKFRKLVKAIRSHPSKSAQEQETNRAEARQKRNDLKNSLIHFLDYALAISKLIDNKQIEKLGDNLSQEIVRKWIKEESEELRKYDPNEELQD